MECKMRNGNVLFALLTFSLILFDFETEAEREAVRTSNPDYGTLITVTNRMAASGDFTLHVTGMGDTEDAKTGYYPPFVTMF